MQPEADTRVLAAARREPEDPTATANAPERVAPGLRAKPEAEPLTLHRWVGRYELIHRLAHGGMATVYLGRAKGKAGFEKVVAVKVIHPHLASEAEFVGMFLDEARIAARIHQMPGRRRPELRLARDQRVDQSQPGGQGHLSAHRVTTILAHGRPIAPLPVEVGNSGAHFRAQSVQDIEHTRRQSGGQGLDDVGSRAPAGRDIERATVAGADLPQPFEQCRGDGGVAGGGVALAPESILRLSMGPQV